MKIKLIFASALLMSSAIVLAGCVEETVLSTSEGAGGSASMGSGGGSASADVAYYNSDQQSLEQARTVFLKNGAMSLIGTGSHLYWTDGTAKAPVLHSLDSGTSTQTNYGFGIGSGTAANYQASDQAVATAQIGATDTNYSVYDATQSAATPIGQFTMPNKAAAEVWKYSVDQKDVYVVEDTADTSRLYKWTVGDTAAKPLFKFEDIGINVTNLQAFTAHDGKVVLINDGKVWSVDLVKQTRLALNNTEAATSVSFDAEGILVGTAKGPLFYKFAGGVIDIAAAIANSGFHLNDTYKDAHLYDVMDNELARSGDTTAYIAENGLFTYDLATGVARPMLLDALDNSVVYKHPVLVTDSTGKKTAFVQGLTSSMPSTTDMKPTAAPIYRVDFTF